VWKGDVFNNTVNDNKASGFRLDVRTFTGDIRNNIANNNGQAHPSGDMPGIQVWMHKSNTPATSGFFGDISGNTASNNNGAGIDVRPADAVDDLFPRFLGNVTNNTTNDNDGSYGVGIRLGSPFPGSGFAEFDGEISGNVAKNNSEEGLDLDVKPSLANAEARVLNNSFSGNDVAGGRLNEVEITNNGTGTLNLTLSGNSSLNSNPGLDDPNNAPFNYDLLNTGGGTFNVTPPNVNNANTGTVGSSDGSVAIP